MKDSILKRYPELTLDDVSLRDDSDGKGVYIDTWKSTKPKPNMADVKKWVVEDEANYKPQKSQLELMQEQIDQLILDSLMGV